MFLGMAAGKIEQLTLEVDGLRTHGLWLDGVGTPTIYVHGNPTHSEDWLPFLERHRSGPALAIDVPGWGRSVRPGHGHFDHTMHELSTFLYSCIDKLRIEDHNLVVHDWGALVLIGAQKRPESVKRLVVIDAVPLLPGYRWHWVARIWRRRWLGELANATTTRRSMALTLRQARGDRSAMPPEFVEMIWGYWDRGTKKAILQLYRDADPDRLAAAGRDLGKLGCPSLVLWGDRDVYLPTKLARDYAEVLPNATLDIRKGAGHWPWLDDPSVVERVLDFVA